MTPEQSLKIPLSDGKFAYARLRGGWDRPLIVFAHGFGVSMNRIIPHEMSKFLDSHGYSFLRFNFYDTPDDARKLITATLVSQIQDLASIIAFVRAHNPPQVHAMGHSLGGLIILMSPTLQADSSVLLDPTHPKVRFLDRATHIEHPDSFRLPLKGFDILVGRPTIEEWQNLKASDFLPQFHTPSLIVSAAGGPLAETNREYAQALNEQTKIKLVEIAGADHAFDTDDALRQLLDASLSWLQSRGSK